MPWIMYWVGDWPDSKVILTTLARLTPAALISLLVSLAICLVSEYLRSHLIRGASR